MSTSFVVYPDSSGLGIPLEDCHVEASTLEVDGCRNTTDTGANDTLSYSQRIH